MWARKRIDIPMSSLFRAVGDCLAPRSRQACQRDIQNCFQSDQFIVCLSVRSGFDLLLGSLKWPPGSEIIFSGLTIGDMPRIARAHGLASIGVEIDWRTTAPSIQQLEAKITPKTKAIVVAHLFGGRCDLTALAKLARKYGLFLIEDCAQAYVGNHYSGSKLADLSMFSFGSIKTNTALGGAILFVRNEKLKCLLKSNHDRWPQQTKTKYLIRVLKYLPVKLVTTWPGAALIRFLFRLGGGNHDSLAAGLAKGFSGHDFFKQIRLQPSDPLLSVLSRRLKQFQVASIEQRTQIGQRLVQRITASQPLLVPLGVDSIDPSFWVFAILVENPDELTQHLWDHGFDATRASSMTAVTSQVLDNAKDADPNNRPVNTQPSVTARLLRHIVFLPLDVVLPSAEIQRMGSLVADVGRPAEEFHSISSVDRHQKSLSAISVTKCLRPDQASVSYRPFGITRPPDNPKRLPQTEDET